MEELEQEQEQQHGSKTQHTPAHDSSEVELIGRLYNVNEKGTNLDIPKKPVVIIGRSSSCDIRIQGIDVSSKHCQLNIIQTTNKHINTRSEYLSITDLSSNGIKINDESMSKRTSIILKTGDKIAFAKTGGCYIFRYIISNQEYNEEDDGNVQLKKKKKYASFFDDYILGKQLGSGHYAVVKEAKDKKTGQAVAVKIFHPNKSGLVNKANSAQQQQEDLKLQQEMNLLLSIDHPNIVKFINHYVEPINNYSVNTYLVLEKMNSGELFQRIINKSKLRIDETKAIFRQILSGLEYLHDHDIIHRDIKPENILLDITPKTSPHQKSMGPWDKDEFDIKVKIADFGLAKFIGELKFTNTLCGTPAYVAPEILKPNCRKYSTKVDLWSLGVLLYVCLCGFPPFSDELGPPNMKEQILTGQYAFYSPYWDEISDVVLDLISNLLIVDPNERFNVEQTLNHFWFNEKEQDSLDNSEGAEESQIVEESSCFSSSSQPSSMINGTKRLMIRSNTQPITLKEQHESQINFKT